LRIAENEQFVPFTSEEVSTTILHIKVKAVLGVHCGFKKDVTKIM
jgi:hypothetical protein